MSIRCGTALCLSVGLGLSAPQAAGPQTRPVVGAPTVAECVSFRSGRLAAGTPFVAPLMRGLEFRLVPARSVDPSFLPQWSLSVTPADGGMGAYLWVASPPLQTSPHLALGPAYGMSTRDNLGLERPLAFVTNEVDYARRLEAVEAALAGDTTKFDALGKMTLGRLGFRVTDYALVGAREARATEPQAEQTSERIDWVQIEGEACIPGERVGPIVKLGSAAALSEEDLAAVLKRAELFGPVWILHGLGPSVEAGTQVVVAYLQPASLEHDGPGEFVRRGRFVQLVGSSTDGDTRRWQAAGAFFYAQVPLSPGAPADGRATDFPFRASGTLSDADILGVVQFIRSSPTGPLPISARPEQEVTIDGMQPIRSIQRLIDGALEVYVRSPEGDHISWRLVLDRTADRWAIRSIGAAIR